MGFSAREWLALWRWGDLTPDEKPHLRYPSVWRWFQAEGVPIPLRRIAALVVAVIIRVEGTFR